MPEAPEAEPAPDLVEPEKPKPKPAEPKPEPVEPSDEEEQKSKDVKGDSEQMQKVKVTSTIATGMPTGCQVWNPVSWFLSLFRVCL